MIDPCSLGRHSEERANALAAAANTLIARGALHEAEALCSQALSMRESLHGPEHPLVVQSMNALAAVLIARGELDTAEPLLERALLASERTIGKRHPSLIVFLSNLAQLQLRRGAHEVAERSLIRLLDLTEASRGEDDTAVALRLEQLAECRVARRDFEGAAGCMRRAATILGRALGGGDVRAVVAHARVVELELLGCGRRRADRGVALAPISLPRSGTIQSAPRSGAIQSANPMSLGPVHAIARSKVAEVPDAQGSLIAALGPVIEEIDLAGRERGAPGIPAILRPVSNREEVRRRQKMTEALIALDSGPEVGVGGIEGLVELTHGEEEDSGELALRAYEESDELILGEEEAAELFRGAPILGTTRARIGLIGAAIGLTALILGLASCERTAQGSESPHAPAAVATPNPVVAPTDLSALTMSGVAADSVTASLTARAAR